MKYSECNARQKKAYMNIYYAANWIIGGLENTMQDNAEDSAEYRSAFEQLNNHEQLVNQIYNEATTAVYDEGFCGFGASDEKFIRDIRFCGRDWLMERCEARVRKAGY